jgi:hypothetical protein
MPISLLSLFVSLANPDLRFVDLAKRAPSAPRTADLRAPARAAMEKRRPAPPLHTLCQCQDV